MKATINTKIHYPKHTMDNDPLIQTHKNIR